MVNTADNVPQKYSQSESNNQLYRVWNGLRRSERTKKDRVDIRTETKERRMDMVVIVGYTKSTRRTDTMKSRTPSRTGMRERQSYESFRTRSEIRVSRLSPDNEAVQHHDTSGLYLGEY